MLGTVDPRTQQNFLRECKQLRREGRTSEALSSLQSALRVGALPFTQLDAAGRLIRGMFDELEQPTLDCHMLGQCTTSFLTAPLVAEAWGRGIALTVGDGEYDSIIQELSGLQSGQERETDVQVLLPWHQRLLAADDRSEQQRIDDELAGWRQAWSMLPPGARLIQVGYDWMHPGAMGSHVGRRFGGDVRTVRNMNDALAEALPPNAYFVDLEQVSAEVGRRAFYDGRNYAWTKQPFSQLGVAELVRHLFAGIRATTVGPKKCLVLDLDNTLWGGVVGELGAHGVELGDSPDGEAFRRFQKFAAALKKRGVLLAVCSKNNPQDAREPFELNRDMVLSLDDIAAFEASWDPKPMAIERISQTLNLGLESFVFFDDNPVEREAIRQQLPMVEVVDVPDDPANYVSALQYGMWFESPGLTAADLQRAEQYCAEQHRRSVQESATSVEEYLRSLKMTAEVSVIQTGDMKRVGQLLARTNQFNLTTRRHTPELVTKMLADDRALGLVLRLTDRFGEYGLVSLVLGEPDEDDPRVLRLDAWLMSCRAIGRTVEHHLMNCVADRARELGYQAMDGEYISSPKNAQVASFYSECGFESQDGSGDVARFTAPLATFVPCETFVRSTASSSTEVD